MRFTTGSVLSFTPDHTDLRAYFRSGQEAWTESVIGWAVELSYAEYEDADKNQSSDVGETDLVPIVIAEDKHAVTIRGYLRDRDGVTFVKLASPAGAR